MDPYKVLGVSINAKQDEIKTAYRNLAKKFHPDLNPGSKEAENKFKEASRAYELIGTPEDKARFDQGETQNRQNDKRSRHEQSGQGPFYYYETQRPGGRYSRNFEGFDPGFFSDLFGEEGFAGRGNKTGSSRTGQDTHYSMDVDFNTSILGGEHEISLPSGKKLRITIPKGIKSGTTLRLANQGEQTSSDMPPGDAYIKINIRPSDLFKRADNDLEVELPLSLNEAVLGGEVRVPTVDGPVMLRVPPGLTTGSRIRMKGKGVPANEGRGDQYAVVKVVMPSHIDSELEKFMKEWSKTNAYNPRDGHGW